MQHTLQRACFWKNSLQSLPSQKLKTCAFIRKAHQLRAQPSPHTQLTSQPTAVHKEIILTNAEPTCCASGRCLPVKESLSEMEVHCHFIALYFHVEQGWVLSHAAYRVCEHMCNTTKRGNVSLVLHFITIALQTFRRSIRPCSSWCNETTPLLGSWPQVPCPCLLTLFFVVQDPFSVGLDTLALVGQRYVHSPVEPLCHESKLV